MIKQQTIICISSIDWEFIWQGHQEIMAVFAKNGNRILFIENTGVRAPSFKDIGRLNKRIKIWFSSIRGFREVQKNIVVYSPIILPFPHSFFARLINKRLLLRPLEKWMKAARFDQPIIWTFLPTGIALDIINTINHKLLVYYCIADFAKLTDKPYKLALTEKEVIRQSDVIFTQGSVLKNKCLQYNNNVHIFPFGVNVEAFLCANPDKEKKPDDIRTIPHPIIGYVGGIHRHIDFSLLKNIAQNRPEWSLVLIGPAQSDLSEIKHINNIFFLGKKEFSILPSYIAEFDVGIIPYKINAYTQTVYPTKMNEYLAMGKPVVSTNLPEVIAFNKENHEILRVASTNEDFIKAIDTYLGYDTPSSIVDRIACAKKNCWTERIELMSRHIEAFLDLKTPGQNEWQISLLRIYKQWRRKMVMVVSSVLIIYAGIFYTPFIWWISEPLIISQNPQKADCILVLAGGVGESGQPEQGYEERVSYAVKLYRQGYSENLLFSSGYTYAFKEPFIMKALAMSEGVPENRIYLETKAKNVYENIIFSGNILRMNKWRTILLVSSPYNMLRASLVAKKQIPAITIVYTPISDSLFYRHGENAAGNPVLKQITMRQIKGLLHEYLGIAYYFLKKYI